MNNLFGEEIKQFEVPEQTNRLRIAKNKDGSFKSNPMLLAYGSTEGQKCKDCTHLICKQYANRYYKCALRTGTIDKCSRASDHKVNWQACGKFESSIK